MEVVPHGRHDDYEEIWGEWAPLAYACTLFVVGRLVAIEGDMEVWLSVEHANDFDKMFGDIIATHGKEKTLPGDFIEGFGPVKEDHPQRGATAFGPIHDAANDVDSLDRAAAASETVLRGLQVLVDAMFYAFFNDTGQDFECSVEEGDRTIVLLLS